MAKPAIAMAGTGTDLREAVIELNARGRNNLGVDEADRLCGDDETTFKLVRDVAMISGDGFNDGLSVSGLAELVNILLGGGVGACARSSSSTEILR